MTIKKYAQEVIKEGKRVRWPKREDILPAIVIVVLTSAFLAAILSLEDVAVGKLLGALEQVFATFNQ